VHCQAHHIVFVQVEEPLGVGLLFKDDSQCCCGKDNFSSCVVLEVSPCVEGSESVCVFESEVAVRSIGHGFVELEVGGLTVLNCSLERLHASSLVSCLCFLFLELVESVIFHRHLLVVGSCRLRIAFLVEVVLPLKYALVFSTCRDQILAPGQEPHIRHVA